MLTSTGARENHLMSTDTREVGAGTRPRKRDNCLRENWLNPVSDFSLWDQNMYFGRT